MHYIRYLKLPKVESSASGKTLKAVITITTDLGDAFYPHDVVVEFLAITSNGTKNGASWRPCGLKGAATWKSYMRALPISLHLPAGFQSKYARLRCQPVHDAGDGTDLLPVVLGVDSSSIRLDSSKGDPERFTARQLVADNGHFLTMWEHAGESIARHLWDAGTAMFYFFASDTTANNNLISAPLREVLMRKSFRSIELGAGCGVFSMAVALSKGNGHFVLSDLEDAEEVAERNIESFRDHLEENQKLPTQRHDQSSEEPELSFQLLPWGEDLPEHINGEEFDLILVSDCTYNPDSSPKLVKTLTGLTAKSSRALIVIAMKMRHPSEMIFFDLMKDAGFVSNERTKIDIPSSDGEEREAQEAIDVWLYQRH